MRQYRIPVRLNTPQALSYTFVDENDEVINLVPFAAASLEVKLQGQLYATLVAAIVNPGKLGQVTLPAPGYTFTVAGLWTVQFYLTDTLGNKVFGEPLLLTAVANVEDLALAQLPAY